MLLAHNHPKKVFEEGQLLRTQISCELFRLLHEGTLFGFVSQSFQTQHRQLLLPARNRPQLQVVHELLSDPDPSVQQIFHQQKHLQD
jgi:hypothetical protein